MENEEKIYLKSSFLNRLLAFIIDQIIILIILFVAIFIFSLFGFNVKSLNNLVYYLISIIYSSILIWKYGATLGKKWLKLKVVSTSYEKVTLDKAILRESIGKLLSGLLFNLGYLTLLIDKQKQTWHDKIAKTYVVSVNPQGEMIPITEETVTKKQKITFWVLIFIFAFPLVLPLIFIIIYLFIVQPNQIKGKAMEPNYIAGQYYLTSKIAYRKNNPQRGDVIIFVSPNNPNLNYIKRIIALPREKVEIKEGRIYINDEILKEPYLAPSTKTLSSGKFLKENQKITVPENQYFVLNDNRAYSLDSREFGFVSKEKIIGKVILCYYNCSSPTWFEKIKRHLRSVSCLYNNLNCLYLYFGDVFTKISEPERK